MGQTAYILLSFILAAVVGFGVWYFTARYYRKRDIGNLVIHNDPKDDTFSIEFKENPKVIFKNKHKFVLLWVKEV